ncbi:MAG: hypothetical protein P4L10_07020 [Acidobacteriaceae bacterium]|nr:hypothetical protein [Acidobacteriaceae bacterium]
MKRFSQLVLGCSLVLTSGSYALAQSSTATTPSVLQVIREYPKPGKGGGLHDKSEGAFVQAMARAKWPTHYIALNSLSGKSRAIYLMRYDSFDAMEKDNLAMQKNGVLSAALEHATVADGDLLDSTDQSILIELNDLSYKSVNDIGHMRYLEATTYRVRPGHGKEWSELVKMVKAGYDKADTTVHWGMYRLAYGGADGTYLVLTSHPTLSEIDHGFLEDKKFSDAMGKDGLKKLDELLAAAVESSDSELFAVNPHQSYPSDEWIKADPDYWKPKPKAAAAPAAKPAPAKATP